MHAGTCIRTCRVPGWDIVYLKCGRRSRLLPIHLAQDGRQIELPPETQDQRALAAFLSFLPSFLRLLFPIFLSPIFYSICFLYFSSPFFYSLRLLASFFSRSASITAPSSSRILGFQGCLRGTGKDAERNGMGRRRERTFSAAQYRANYV